MSLLLVINPKFLKLMILGVGFSYSGDASDYITNDPKTAADNYEFLKVCNCIMLI